MLYTLINQAELRNKLIDRVDVLNKVKELFLIPKLKMMSIGQVADFFEVNTTNIRQILLKHRDELEQDGIIVYTGKELRQVLSEITLVKKLDNTRISIDIPGAKSITVGNSKTKFFPPRAVLRIGMLLRDSEVAKEVRTQLLKNEKTYSALALYNLPLYSSSRYNHSEDKGMERRVGFIERQ